MAMAGTTPDTTPDITPGVREYGWGSEVSGYGWGSRVFAWGTPALPPRIPPQTPERLIVRAGRETRWYNHQANQYETGVLVYAVYQPGGEFKNTSIIYESSGIRESDTTRGRVLVAQDFNLIARAKRFDDLVDIVDGFYAALRTVAGSRFNGISGSWSDNYNPQFENYERIFSVTIRK